MCPKNGLWSAGLIGVRKEVLDEYRTKSGRKVLDLDSIKSMCAKYKCAYVDLPSMAYPDIGPVRFSLSNALCLLFASAFIAQTRVS